MAARPASNTPLSSETEIRCSFLNSASSGLPAAVAWTDPICTRSATTKLRKTPLPSHRLKPRNSIVRRIDTIGQTWLPLGTWKSEPKLLYRSTELLHSGDVAYGIGHQIDWSND